MVTCALEVIMGIKRNSYTSWNWSLYSINMLNTASQQALSQMFEDYIWFQGN